VYLRCHFDYAPNEDKEFPKGEIPGLAFQRGDILEVVDQTDCNWWQVCVLFCVFHTTLGSLTLLKCLSSWILQG